MLVSSRYTLRVGESKNRRNVRDILTNRRYVFVRSTGGTTIAKLASIQAQGASLIAGWNQTEAQVNSFRHLEIVQKTKSTLKERV